MSLFSKLKLAKAGRRARFKATVSSKSFSEQARRRAGIKARRSPESSSSVSQECSSKKFQIHLYILL